MADKLSGADEQVLVAAQQQVGLACHRELQEWRRKIGGRNGKSQKLGTENRRKIGKNWEEKLGTDHGFEKLGTDHGFAVLIERKAPGNRGLISSKKRSVGVAGTAA
ncbi:MAG: hypothetical protein AB7I68_05560 [Porticoccaceae bacterium]